MKNTVVDDDHLAISSDKVFFSVQGEGVSMGKPCVFLRLHYCNLRCKWCDTFYTWGKGSGTSDNDLLVWTIKETKKKIEESWHCNNKLVKKRLVITGGEPLLQKKSIDKLIKMMPDWDFEVETNGTIMPTDNMLSLFQFNCSPKLKNSGNSRKLRINKQVLRVLNEHNASFKFVVSRPEDINEIDRDFVKSCKLDVSKIIVMPQGKKHEEIVGNALKVIEKTKENGYRLLGRLHVDLWGDKRKV